MRFIRFLIGFSLVFLLVYPLPRWLSRITSDFYFSFPGSELLGIAGIVLGLLLVIWTVSLFFLVGKGTPVSTDPPAKLVVSGPYRYTRNPMALGYFGILLGEALLWQSLGALLYLVAAILFFHRVVIPREENDLERRFGEAYLDYKNTVPRWIPKLSR